MVKSFLKAPFVLLVLLVLLGVLYGPLAAAVEPLFDAFASTDGVASDDTPVGPGNLDSISRVLFVEGPFVFVAGAILFIGLAALKFEGVLR